jgi:branched-chain amino acid aminotransferase
MLVVPVAIVAAKVVPKVADLQTPKWVYVQGALTPWADARIHVGAEALTRGISVFEGIKGYWRHDGSALGLLAVRQHYERLCRSAALQHLPFTMQYGEFVNVCSELVNVLKIPEKDLWIRPTVLSLEGHWGESTVSDLVITCYNQEKQRPAPIDVGVSTWQRAQDNVLPTRIKSAANYQSGRIARIEGRRQGFSDMIMLNTAGRVAEATGSCVVMVRDGGVVSPPSYEGCLESITVNIIAALCDTYAIPFERRPIDRTELLTADALCLVGTLAELTRVRRI